ncbi:MAG: hypothetical protein ABI599_01525 [Flavobacteriales bacterium]
MRDTAETNGLFAKGDIKVRILEYEQCIVGGMQQDLIHVLGHSMQGRKGNRRKPSRSRSLHS